MQHSVGTITGIVWSSPVEKDLGRAVTGLMLEFDNGATAHLGLEQEQAQFVQVSPHSYIGREVRVRHSQELVPGRLQEVEFHSFHYWTPDSSASGHANGIEEV